MSKMILIEEAKLKQALKDAKWLDNWIGEKPLLECNKRVQNILTTLRTAIEQAENSNIKQVIHLYDEPPAAPVQEPVGEVGWAAKRPNTVPVVHWVDECPEIGTKLYTTPPAAPVQDECVVCGDKVRVIPRPWTGLTEDEQDDLVYNVFDSRTRMELAIGIEAKLKEKNT